MEVSPQSGTGSTTLTVSLVPSKLPTYGTYAATISFHSAGDDWLQPQLTVTLRSSLGPYGTYGAFDSPRGQRPNLSGSVAVTGWALDAVGVTSVDIWRDPVPPELANIPVYIGQAVMVPGARPDVEAKYPDAPMAFRAGGATCC